MLQQLIVRILLHLKNKPMEGIFISIKNLFELENISNIMDQAKDDGHI